MPQSVPKTVNPHGLTFWAPRLALGDGEAKATPNNPRGFSKRQINVLSFLRDRDGKANTNQSNVDGHFSSWGNEKNSFRGIANEVIKSKQNDVMAEHEMVVDVII